MPEAVLSALLGLFGLYVAGVTFSLQQLSDRYSPRLLPRLRRRHVSKNLWVLVVLVALAGVLVAVAGEPVAVAGEPVAGKNHDWATPMALLLLLGSVVYARWLLPQGWGLASLDVQQGWLRQDDLTPDIVQDMLSRLTLRRDGVALVTVLSSVRDRDELEVTLNQWFEDRPELLAEGWCGPVIVRAWTEGLAEHNAERRRGVLIKTVSRHLQLPGMPNVSELIYRIMTAVEQSDTREDDVKRLVVDLGRILTFEPGSVSKLRKLTGEVVSTQDQFNVRLEHIRDAVVKSDVRQAAWFADLLGELLREIPEEGLINEALEFAVRPEMTGKWTVNMGESLLRGLHEADKWSRQYRDRFDQVYATDEKFYLADPTLKILAVLRDLPISEMKRRHLASFVVLGPELVPAFRLAKYQAIGLASKPDELAHAPLPKPSVSRGGDWFRAVCRGLKRRGNG